MNKGVSARRYENAPVLCEQCGIQLNRALGEHLIRRTSVQVSRLKIEARFTPRRANTEDKLGFNLLFNISLDYSSVEFFEIYYIYY